MEPLPLIPRIQTTLTPEIGCLVREVFQDAFRADTATWRISTSLSKSCSQNEDLNRIATQIQAKIIEHKGTLNDLEGAEMQIMISHGYQLCRDQRMSSSERAMEIIRLKRHPLYMDLHPNIVEKYPLLQSDDLLPPTHELATDFRLDRRERTRMKRQLHKSRDSLDDMALQKVTSKVCRFDNTAEQKIRRMTCKERKLMMRKATRKRSIIKSECVKTILIAEPEEVFFHNFEYNKIYKKFVLIKNISSSMATYKIERRSPGSKFTVLCDAGAVETMKIAPGIHIRLTVSFVCNVIEDPEESLIVNVQSGKTICVKLWGYRDPPLLREAGSPVHQICSSLFDFEVENSSSSFLGILEAEGEHEAHTEQLTRTLESIDENGKGEPRARRNVNLGVDFECGKCFVGERISVVRRFVNEGGDGKFFIISEIDWCTMNIDDVMDCNMILIPPFAIWPIYFKLRYGQAVDISTYFYPESYGMQADKLYIMCDNHSVRPIELVGDGILYDPNLFRFSDNVNKRGSPENDDEPLARYHLNMGDVGSAETLETTVLVTNGSELEMYFRWEKHSSMDSASCPKIWEHLPLEIVTIQPAEGSLGPHSITPFRVSARTNNLQAGEYRAFIRLYIEDIPLAAISKDCDSNSTKSRTKRRNCNTTMDVLLADIELWVRCIPGKVSLAPALSEKTEQESRCSDEAEEMNNVYDHYSSSSSVTGSYNIHKESSNGRYICGMDDVQCNEYPKGMTNSENLWREFLGTEANLDDDTLAEALPRLKSNHQVANVAILIPEKPLYVGIEETFTLTLRNLTCKPVSYAWGRSPDSNRSKMKVYFKPEKGSIVPPANTATIEVICLPMDTGTLENFFTPCSIGGQEHPVMLGIECIIDSLYVTFLFLPAPNDILSPCVDSVRVEWHKYGHTSALNLSNLNMSQDLKLVEEQELKTIDLDAGQVVATAAVGPTTMKAENVSIVSLPEVLLPESTVKQELEKAEQNTARSESAKRNTPKDENRAEFESDEVNSPIIRSWENLLQGIVWSDDRPDEFISLSKPKAVVPFYKTIVPPVVQDLAIEFINLPLRTVAKRTFVIRNNTIAESEFVITLKNFGSAKRRKALSPRETIDVTYANVMGRKSENYWEEIKPHGQGVLLVIEPTSGILASRETIPIDIYVYADTWGVYVDEVTVAIVGLPNYVFGVCIQVVGSPIEYPISKNGINRMPVLRFGDLDVGTESITRKILIENTSSVILTVNWHSFLMDPARTEDLIPFTVVLEMFSPLTNAIASTWSGHRVERISAVDTTSEESCQASMYSEEFDSGVRSSTLSDDSYRSKCYSRSIVSPARIPTQEKDRENSDGTDKPDHVSVEYSTDSEMQSGNPSGQTVDKETELELTLTRYYGEPDYFIFKVSPEELTIPAKEKRWIEITLNTKSCWDKFGGPDGRDKVVGHLVGFLRVAPMHKYKADCYSREDGGVLTPAEIRLETAIMRPMLSHAITEDDRTFEIFASSMFTYFRKKIKIRRQYLFSNNERQATLVNVRSTNPFQVLSLSLSTQKAMIDPSECDSLFVAPGQSVEVDVLCSVGASWIDKAIEIGEHRSAEDLYVDTGRGLLIDHVGLRNQVVPLCLRIYFPLLKLSTNRIEFGTVCIRDSRRSVLSIENISNEKQILNIRAKKDNKDFEILPNKGVLARGKATLDVSVVFTASKLHKSIEVLEISTSVPNYMEECIVEGWGDLDEEYAESGE